MGFFSSLGSIIKAGKKGIISGLGDVQRAKQAAAQYKALQERLAAPVGASVSAGDIARAGVASAKTVAPSTAVPKTAFTLPAAGGGGGGGGGGGTSGFDLLSLRQKLAKQLGIANLQKQLEGLLGQSEKEQALLTALPKDIQGRTSNFLMSGAQRNRLEAAERQPIWERLQSFLTGAQPIQRQLTSAQDTLREMLSLALSQEQLRRSGAKSPVATRLQIVNMGGHAYTFNPATGEYRDTGLASPSSSSNLNPSQEFAQSQGII